MKELKIILNGKITVQVPEDSTLEEGLALAGIKIRDTLRNHPDIEVEETQTWIDRGRRNTK